DEVVDQARSLAAELLEASVDDVVLEKVDGRFHVTGTPAIGRTWAEVATEAAARHPGAGLKAAVDFTSASPTFPFGAHVAVVDVDTETGQVTLTRLIACDDAGRILNPMLVEGQRHGGIAQGAAQALMEEVRFDDSGNPVTANLADYAMISAAELPSFELVSMETPTPLNPLGAKGVGESGAIGATPAVQSAVCDALAHLGVRHVDIPCTPEKVWRAIEQAKATL
ncbi:MAG: aerobic carbon-monoxide dehydrogenase large subunit, partial [Acidimicrobiaceae bacterium]